METVERANHWISHFLLGGLVPVGIIADHNIETWWRAGADTFAFWKQVIIYVGLWVLAFLILWGVNEIFEFRRRLAVQRQEEARWRQQKEFDSKPIKLNDIGEVDGDWIDAVYENDKLKQGSIITITSTNKDGFKVTGHTFDFDTEREKFGETVHYFKSIDAMPLAQGPGIGYVFTGTETEGIKTIQHDGAGYYEFKWSAQQEKLFGGAFFAEAKRYIRKVDGQYIGKGQTLEHKKQRLYDFLVKVNQLRIANAEK
jgi:hypothetical protein